MKTTFAVLAAVAALVVPSQLAAQERLQQASQTRYTVQNLGSLGGTGWCFVITINTVHALAGVPLEKLKASGTPTLLLVDKSGTVLNAWIGMLSPRQELEVIGAATVSASPASTGSGSIAQNEVRK